MQLGIGVQDPGSKEQEALIGASPPSIQNHSRVRRLPLALLVLRVLLIDDVNAALPAHNLVVRAPLLYAGTNFHGFVNTVDEKGSVGAHAGRLLPVAGRACNNDLPDGKFATPQWARILPRLFISTRIGDRCGLEMVLRRQLRLQAASPGTSLLNALRSYGTSMTSSMYLNVLSTSGSPRRMATMCS